jgi:hypothetical protein
VLSGNQVGIVVGEEAKLALTGDGSKGGVIVENTTQGAGVLVLRGGANAAVLLEGLWAKGNGTSSADGTGAVEIRRGRLVTVKSSVIEGNLQAITLNGEDGSSFTSFASVRIDGNLFKLQAEGVGSVICGSQLSSEVKLTLGTTNIFPSLSPCPSTQVDSCDGGVDVGSDTANTFQLSCGQPKVGGR